MGSCGVGGKCLPRRRRRRQPASPHGAAGGGVWGSAALFATFATLPTAAEGSASEELCRLLSPPREARRSFASFSRLMPVTAFGLEGLFPLPQSLGLVYH